MLELCRSVFIRINETLFPTGPQPQGIHALLGLFHSAGPIRDFITQKILAGANTTVAYVGSQHPQLVLGPPDVGVVLSQQHLDGIVNATRLKVEHYHVQFMGPVFPVKDEPED